MMPPMYPFPRYGSPGRWHDEVRQFAETLCKMTGGKYGTACEHRHSCCTLLAQQKFCVDGVWNTWINYPKFHEIEALHRSTGGEQTFSATDYMAPTPSWALWGAKEDGFDPAEKRFYRKGKGPKAEKEVSAA